jgi:hypothetical protein
MPRRTTSRKTRQRKPPPAGFYDLSTIKLPGGSEMDALGTGFATQRSRMQGYRQGQIETEARANIATVTYTQSALGVIDPNKHGGLLLPMSAARFRTDYADELKAYDTDNGKVGDDRLYDEIKPSSGIGQGITNDTWMKRFGQVMGVGRGQSRYTGLPQDRHFMFPTGTLVAGGQTFKNLLNANRPMPVLLLK